MRSLQQLLVCWASSGRFPINELDDGDDCAGKEDDGNEEEGQSVSEEFFHWQGNFHLWEGYSKSRLVCN